MGQTTLLSELLIFFLNKMLVVGYGMFVPKYFDLNLANKMTHKYQSSCCNVIIRIMTLEIS